MPSWTGEWLRALSPVVAVLVAAWIAWSIRRAEQLKGAYAEWAASIHLWIEYEWGTRPVPGLSLRGPGELNPVWVEHENERHRATAAIGATRARLLVLEPNVQLRRLVEQLSDIHPLATDAWERVTPPLSPPEGFGPNDYFYWRKLKRVDSLIRMIAESESMFLSWREIRELDEPRFERLPSMAEIRARNVR